MVVLCLASLVAPGGAWGQSASSVPSLVRQGLPTSAVVGEGQVTVRVLVTANGTASDAQIERSNNADDNPAALEIARSSVYRPAIRNGKPIDAPYVMALNFAASSVVNDTGAVDKDILAANGLIRAKRFAESKQALVAFLAGHPNEPHAEALLGVAESYLGDTAGAMAAFDSAGPIPEAFKVVAAKTYADAAVDALKARDNARAIALATKAMALQQSVNVLYIRGTAYANAQDYPNAITDLENAKTQARAGHADKATLNAIDASLATALIFGGQPAAGMALADELRGRDPGNTRIEQAVAAYYNQMAVAAMHAGDGAGAVRTLEQGAAAAPSKAVALYVQAANVLAQGPSPDWSRVEAESQKALSLDPNDAGANYVVGIARANHGDRVGGAAALQRARANVGADDALRTDIDKALGKLGG
jgi:TonB family protein